MVNKEKAAGLREEAAIYRMCGAMAMAKSKKIEAQEAEQPSNNSNPSNSTGLEKDAK